MKLRKFSKPKFLEQIGRGLLARLLARFDSEFSTHEIAPPDVGLDDDAFYKRLAKLAVAPQGLPDAFIEALYSIESMANAEGKARLMHAVVTANVPIERIQDVTHADFATQVLLAAPALFAQKQDEARVVRLCSFEYFGSSGGIAEREMRCAEEYTSTSLRQPSPAPAGHPLPSDGRGASPQGGDGHGGAFRIPDEATLGRIKRDIDEWLAAEHEGDERVTEIEVFDIEGECMFLIRRGDAFARVPTVERGRVTIRHFRPARDLVAGYSPERDELRIHAKSVREKRMVREVFGRRLFGEPDRFLVRKRFTLEPLRTDGPDALSVAAGGGIDRIVLTELEVHSEDEHDAVLIWKAKDWFACAESMGLTAVPAHGRLVRAAFEIYFTGKEKPRPVHVAAGNKLRLARHCDAAAVHRWLMARGFRSAEGTAVNRIARQDANLLGRD